MAKWLKMNPDGLKDDFNNYFKNLTEEQLQVSLKSLHSFFLHFSQPFEEAGKEVINTAAREVCFSSYLLPHHADTVTLEM